MNKHALEVLEYYQILNTVSEYASSEPGQRYILHLEPYSSFNKIVSEHKKVTEIKKILKSGRDIPIGGLSDVIPHVREARIIDKVLEPAKLQNIALFLSAVRSVSDFIKRCKEEMPTCYDVSDKMIVLRHLEQEIYATIGPDGTVRDNASPELKRLRSSIRVKEVRIQEKLDSFKKNSALKDALQDDFITQRNGRYVIPVKINHRGDVKGIIHDKSNSGETVFIEPESIISDSNELAELKLMESLEVEKILRRLGAAVRDESESIELNYEILSYIDALYGMVRNFAVMERIGKNIKLVATRFWKVLYILETINTLQPVGMGA